MNSNQFRFRTKLVENENFFFFGCRNSGHKIRFFKFQVLQKSIFFVLEKFLCSFDFTKKTNKHRNTQTKTRAICKSKK